MGNAAAVRREIDGVGVEAEARAGQQEGVLVEPALGHRRQAAHFGLADRPAELLADIEQRPHQRIDRRGFCRRPKPRVGTRHSPEGPLRPLRADYLKFSLNQLISDFS